MPLFGKKKDTQKSPEHKSKGSNANNNHNDNGHAIDKGNKHQQHGTPKKKNSSITSSILSSSNQAATDHYSRHSAADEMAQTKPKLIFHCQQAHGSPTASISGFSNVKELYSSIGDAFEVDPTDVSGLFSISIYLVNLIVQLLLFQEG